MASSLSSAISLQGPNAPLRVNAGLIDFAYEQTVGTSRPGLVLSWCFAL